MCKTCFLPAFVANAILILTLCNQSWKLRSVYYVSMLHEREREEFEIFEVTAVKYWCLQTWLLEALTQY